MGFDLKRAVDIVQDDIRAAYKKDPSAIWKLPFIVMHANGETVELPTDRIADMNPEEGSAYMSGWLNHFRDAKRIEAVVVGRQVVKMSGVLGPDGQPTLKEKGLMVSGYSFSNGRTIVSITPTKEFQDFRSTEAIQEQGMLPNPGLNTPDAVKVIAGAHGESTLICQFGKEERHDSQQGDTCIADPIINGVLNIAKQEALARAEQNQAVGSTTPDTSIFEKLKDLKIPLGKKLDK